MNHEVADWDGPSIQDQLVHFTHLHPLTFTLSFSHLLSPSLLNFTQWGALKYVCSILPEVKIKYGYTPDKSLFNEPVGDQACFSQNHW
jgi:hypothetical protein